MNNKGILSTILEVIAYICFVCVLGVCIAGMIFCFNTLKTTVIVKQRDFSNTMTEIKEASRSDQVSVDTLIAHMEAMEEIQKSSTTNDLMAFIYGMLSSILVGLCAGFVMTSRKIADEAKKAAQDANNSINQVTGEIHKLNVEVLNAKKSLESVKKSMPEIIQIRHNIALAEINLIKLNRPRANDRISEIRKLVKTLCEENSNFDAKNDIVSLVSELKRLKIYVDEVIRDCEDNENSIGHKTLVSMQQASDNYHKWLDESIAACESVLKYQP